MKTSVFKSPERRDAMRSCYRGILSKFPFEQMYLDTRFGKTFILAAGDKLHTPIVLLHGSNSNSAFWFPELMALSANFRVYAVDILGEAGNSEEFRPDLDSNDFADWLRETQDALGIESSIVIGNSLGGWMSLKFATTYPKRVSKLVVIAAAGLAPVHKQFLQKVDDARQDDGTVPVTAEIVGESSIPKEILEFMNLIAQSYNPIQELPIFHDEQLLKLSMPLVFIGGEDDVVINTADSEKRLLRLLPSAKTIMVPNCGHVITNAIEHILPFLNDND